MLAHELAHHARRDPLRLVVHGCVAALGCLQPLNLLASRRLADAAELLADEWAVAHTGRTRDLAECLTTVARWAVDGPRPLAASAMARPGSMLEHRVARLLLPTEGRGRGPRPLRRPLALVPLVLVAVFAPAITAGAPEARTPLPPSVEHAPPTQALTRLDAEIDALEGELQTLVHLLAEVPEPPPALRSGITRLRARVAAFHEQRDALARAARAPLERIR